MRYEKLQIISFIMAFAFASRLIPHLPNFTPIIALCLLAGRELKQISAIVILMACLIISDGLIAWLHHYAWFGSWTFFTYTGFIIIIWLGQGLQQNATLPLQILSAITAGIGFWLWTNFGVWLTSGMYQLSINGLTTCYLAALPFLQYELLGDFCWGTIIFGASAWLQKKYFLSEALVY